MKARPEIAARLLGNPLTRTLLRALTRQRPDGGCELSDIFARYGQSDLLSRERLRYGVAFALIDASSSATRFSVTGLGPGRS